MKINYKRGTCKGPCGREDVLIVQKSLCLCIDCNQKRLVKRYTENRKKKIDAGEKADKQKLVSFYKEVWSQQPHICYETGERSYHYHSWHVHHVLHKEDYPRLAFNHDICVLLSHQAHNLWHSLAPSDRAKKMPKTYRRYLELLSEYDPLEYEDLMKN